MTSSLSGPGSPSDPLEGSDRGRARSRTSPLTLTASAARARPGPIAAAASAPVAPSGRVRTLPSGSSSSIAPRMLVRRGRSAARDAEAECPDDLGADLDLRTGDVRRRYAAERLVEPHLSVG